MAAPDVTSAEWIAEAPSTRTPGGARILPLSLASTGGGPGPDSFGPFASANGGFQALPTVSPPVKHSAFSTSAASAST